MLIVISDLHFVDETAGKHNLPVDAFEEVFLSDVVELAIRKQAQEITLLLLGDIPDLIRSDHWLHAPMADRPWGENGLADVRNYRTLGGEPTNTEKICLRILGQMPANGRKSGVKKKTILRSNWDTFVLFRNLEQEIHQRIAEKQKGMKPAERLETLPPVQLVYVPGNHDRLVNLYPSVRDEWQKIANLTIIPATRLRDAGDWWYRYDFRNSQYGAYGRHGHQFDAWNYGGGHDITSREAHLQLPMGDIIATEFAVGLVHEAHKLRDQGKIDPELVERLEDVDNVRPLERLLEWLYYEIEHNQTHKEALDEIVDTVVKNILDIPFVREWRTPLSGLDDKLRATNWLRGLADPVERLNPPGVDEFFRIAATNPMRWLLKKMVDFTDSDTLLRFFMIFAGQLEGHGDPAGDTYVQAAYREHVWKNNPNYHFIFYGHTHSPGVWPLDGSNDREVFYINSGTWRERIHRTVALDRRADFIKLKQMTYVVVYGPGENGDWDGGNKAPDTPSFDMWTGTKLKHYR